MDRVDAKEDDADELGGSGFGLPLAHHRRVDAMRRAVSGLTQVFVVSMDRAAVGDVRRRSVVNQPPR